MTCRLLNLELHRLSWDEALTIERGVVFTPNVDHLMQMQRDENFYALYQKATYRLCDSRILWWASGWVDPPRLPAQLAGADFFPAYCLAHTHEVKVFLLGGDTPAIGAEARERLNQRAGCELIIDAYSPPFDFEKDPAENARILARIQASGADVLAVGLGAPKQERWIMQHREQLPEVRLFFAVGKTIDFMAGATPRAPQWMTRAGLEWAYRMLQEPRRLARRYLVEDLPVFRLLWQQKRGRYQNPWRE